MLTFTHFVRFLLKLIYSNLSKIISSLVLISDNSVRAKSYSLDCHLFVNHMLLFHVHIEKMEVLYVLKHILPDSGNHVLQGVSVHIILK